MSRYCFSSLLPFASRPWRDHVSLRVSLFSQIPSSARRRNDAPHSFFAQMGNLPADYSPTFLRRAIVIHISRNCTQFHVCLPTSFFSIFSFRLQVTCYIPSFLLSFQAIWSTYLCTATSTCSFFAHCQRYLCEDKDLDFMALSVLREMTSVSITLWGGGLLRFLPLYLLLFSFPSGIHGNSVPQRRGFTCWGPGGDPTRRLLPSTSR